MKRSSNDLVKTDLKPTPYVGLRELPAGVTELKFVGIYGQRKEVEGAYGKQAVHELRLKETNAPMFVKKDQVNVDAGELVSLFATKTLDDKITGLATKAGETVTIVYKGKAKNPKSGRYYHSYSVEVE